MSVLFMSVAYLIMFIPWIVFASAAMNSRVCRPVHVAGIGVAHAIGTLGATVWSLAPSHDLRGFLVAIFVAPVMGGTCALLSVCACRILRT